MFGFDRELRFVWGLESVFDGVFWRMYALDDALVGVFLESMPKETLSASSFQEEFRSALQLPALQISFE